jgi:hypothetical protein
MSKSKLQIMFKYKNVPDAPATFCTLKNVTPSHKPAQRSTL